MGLSLADVGGPSGAPSGRSGARITAALRGSTSPTALWRASLAGDPQVGTSDLPRQARLQFATRAPTPLRRLADDRPRLWGSNTAVRWRTPLFSAQSASLAPTRARRFFFRDTRRPNIGASPGSPSSPISFHSAALPTPCRPFKNAHPPRALHPCWQDTAARRALAQGLHGRLQDKRLLGAAGEEVVSLQGREGHIRSRGCGSAGGLCVPQWHPGLSPVVRRWLHTGVAHARTSALCNHGFICKSACATLRAGRRDTCATLGWSVPNCNVSVAASVSR